MSIEKPTPAQTIAGGETLTLPTVDGEKEFFVRQVKPSELIKYLKLENQAEDAVLSLTCKVDGKPVNIDDLPIETYEALLEADQRQNFSAARRKEKRETDRAVRQMNQARQADPATFDLLEKELKNKLPSLISSQMQSQTESAVGGAAPMK